MFLDKMYHSLPTDGVIAMIVLAIMALIWACHAVWKNRASWMKQTVPARLMSRFMISNARGRGLDLNETEPSLLERLRRKDPSHVDLSEFTYTFTLSFELQSGEVRLFDVPGRVYDQMQEDTRGMLTFRGSRFISFKD